MVVVRPRALRAVALVCLVGTANPGSEVRSVTRAVRQVLRVTVARPRRRAMAHARPDALRRTLGALRAGRVRQESISATAGTRAVTTAPAASSRRTATQEMRIARVAQAGATPGEWARITVCTSQMVQLQRHARHRLLRPRRLGQNRQRQYGHRLPLLDCEVLATLLSLQGSSQDNPVQDVWVSTTCRARVF